MKEVNKQVKQDTTSIRLLSQQKQANKLATHNLKEGNNSSGKRALPNAHICN
jgi:hypothetical protein